MPAISANFIQTFNPSEGTGTRTVRVSLRKHTGRVDRQQQVTGTTGSSSDTCTIYQYGAKEFISFDRAEYMMNADMETITLYGTSNSPNIAFSYMGVQQDSPKDDGYTLVNSFLKNPTSYTVTKIDGSTVTATNATDIPYDPGNIAQFSFAITLALKDNYVGTYSKEKMGVYATKAGSGELAATCYVKRTSSYIQITSSYNTETAYVDADAETVNIIVDSNDAWALAQESVVEE